LKSCLGKTSFVEELMPLPAPELDEVVVAMDNGKILEL